ncbi:MAG: NAD(P)-dependent alcohol dehydrogenase [Mariniphaga sp.]|nr:NAD(P)-dependent alcohol dehydrogenase [Mariniphaga sp.]
MKAVVCPKYGPPEVLQFKEIEKPIPKDNEVLIKIFATTVNAADARIRGAVFPSMFNIPVRLFLGIRGPRKKILGVELAGEIETVGKNISRFKEGDQIFASTGADMSAHAEYVCLPENAEVAIKPTNMTYEEAAAVPHCALAALFFLNKGNIHNGQKILIYGASGGIGTFAVQIAKSLGAEVTGVCSTANIQMVKSLGADNVIDYTKKDLNQINGTYDIIFDTIGKSPISACGRALNKNGLYMLAVHMDLPRIIEGMKVSRKNKIKIIAGVAAYSVENLNYLKDLIESGKMKTVIDKNYTFEQIIEAHEYVDTGHKKGHVVITMNPITKS